MTEQADLTAILEPELPNTLITRAVTRSSVPRDRARRLFWALATTALSLSLFLLAWYIATLYRFEFYVRFTNIPTPGAVFDAFIAQIQVPAFQTHIVNSVRRIAIGFGLAVIVAVPLGLAIGRYERFRVLVYPAIDVLRPIPAIAWVPMSIMLWPTNETSICFITFLGAFYPILVNTVGGVSAIDAVYLRAARTLGATEMFLLRTVVLPAALPHIFTGATVGIGVAWVSLIAAEMISGQFGIGYFTWEAYSLVQYADIALGMATIGLFGFLSSEIVRRTGDLVMPGLAFRVQERH
jgi:NitT/TauT family transport system permease protein